MARDEAETEAETGAAAGDRPQRWGIGRAPAVAVARRTVERGHWRDWARAIMADEDGWMLLDTETTGTQRDADIMEVAAVTPSGRVLLDTLIRPRQPIPHLVEALTGITGAMVVAAPSFPFAYQHTLWEHLSSRKILAYNVSFDVRMLRANILRHCRKQWEPVGSACLMRAYARFRGETFPPGHPQAGRPRPVKLELACQQMGIAHDDAHRALQDCLVSARLLRAMADYS